MSDYTPTPDEALFEVRVNATTPNSAMSTEGFDAALAQIIASARRGLSHRDEFLLNYAEAVAAKRAQSGTDTEEGGVIRSLIGLVERLR